MTGPVGFLGLPRRTIAQLDHATAAIIGVSEASPYRFEPESHSADAPDVLREISQKIARSLNQYDFDLDMTLFPTSGEYRGLFDVGNVATDPDTAETNRDAISSAIARILATGAVPVVLGGDDSVPIPVLAGYRDHGPIWVLQIDAHVDWADRIDGNAYGYGSPMRRAAEYAWVTGMVQLGIRGLGSGQSWQHDDARAWGSHIVTSYAFHRDGVASLLAPIPDGADIFVSIDCDGIDPSVFPAVNMPTPGGLSYEELILVLKGVANKGRLAGVGVFEYVPSLDDPRQLSGQIAARLAMASLALAVARSERERSSIAAA